MKRTSVTFVWTRHAPGDHELEEVHTGTFDELRDFPGRPVYELAFMLTKPRVMFLPKLGNAHDRHANARVLEADLRTSSFLGLGTNQHLALIDDVSVVGGLVLPAQVLAARHDAARKVLLLACYVNAGTGVHERPHSHQIIVIGDLVDNVR